MNSPLSPFSFVVRAAAIGALLARVPGAGAQVVINEILCDPADNTKPAEFVELYNAGADPVNIGLWRLEDGVDCIIPAGTVMGPSSYFVIAENAVAFQAVFGFAPNAVFTGQLSASGENLRLLDSASAVVDEVEYATGFPWPTAPRGGGASLELIHPSLDNNLAGSWRASGGIGGNLIILPAGDPQWHWRKGDSEASAPVEAWRTFNFVEDATWTAAAPLPLGFGDIDGNAANTDTPTTVDGMQSAFQSVFLRHTFTINPGQTPSVLRLRVRCDDGCIAWINGVEVPVRIRATGVPTFDASGMTIGKATEPPLNWEAAIVIPNAQSLLQTGTNVLALQVFNETVGSSDLFVDAELSVPVSPNGTPGAANSAYAVTAPPALRQVMHVPVQPSSGVPVVISAKATDPDGVASVTLDYQAVDPGAYIRKKDAAYATAWTTVAMHDDGLDGDAIAGDAIFSVELPATLQVHRRLLRYRLNATDTTAATVRVPYADDEQPNFAYFCYDGIPDWTGRNQPPSSAPSTFPSSLMTTLPAYQLIANGTDVANSQWNSSFDTIRMWGTLVYDGRVYDHILFHNKGSASTYQCGKNKWRFHFNRARDFEARDSWGRKYRQPWDTFTMHACASPWNPVFRGWAGLDEIVSTRVYELAGAPSPHMHHLHFRVVDNVTEAPADQYTGDLWGLYMAVEDPDGSFLDERGLPDGNVYHLAETGDKTHQGATHPVNISDWSAFRSGSQKAAQTEEWWRANLDLDAYFNFHAGNRITGNVDLREGWNHYLYHRGTDNRWLPIPWDIDMMYFPETHWSGTIDQKNCLRIPAINLEFKNRARELLDLICEDGTAAGGQFGQLVDEYKRIIRPAGEPLGWDLLDQYMWNYNPRTTGGHRGHFYLPNPFTDTIRIGGTWTRTYPTADFAGVCDWMIAYATDTDPNGFAVGDGDQRGYGYNFLELEGTDAAAPARPTCAHAGAGPYPANDLRFTASAFIDPQGDATFAAMQWRVGEIAAPGLAGYVPGDPFTYEVTDVFRSAELAPYSSQYRLPVAACRPDHTYRVRVRMKDDTGRWSRWSPAVQFVPAAPDVSVYRQSLAITEVMYHPFPAGADEIAHGWTDDDFEFIEIMNTGPLVIDLTDVRFTKGIDFDFPAGFLLDPGAVTLVVRNTAAFTARHGGGRSIAGQWDAGDRLSNDGEEIKLSYGAGTEILSVIYGDAPPWPAADSGGVSLHFVNAGAAAQASAAAWFAAAPTPGTVNPDADGDGQDNAAEFFAGTDPTSSGSRFDVRLTAPPGGPITGTFDGVAGKSYRVYWSNDLIAWQPLGAEILPLVTGPLQFTDATLPPESSRFYKVVTPAP